MKIGAFKFGSIEIDGKRYAKDVLIDSGCSINKRKGGFLKFGSHNISKDEIEDLASSEVKPDLIIVGLGTSSAARLDPEATTWASESGIELVAIPSAEAVERFNQEQEEGSKAVAALIHITC
ncbi:MAG: hypothetical protein JW854_01265 [Actinobacteria bacterium]|nr:hypothetical protein [Actinomycetota bacterium]